MNDLLQQICRQQQIERAVAPRVYVLPKLHKDNARIRPVVSFIKSPTYNSSRLIWDILNKIVDKEKYYINNSYM